MRIPESVRAVCFDIGGVLVDVGSSGFLAEELAEILDVPARLVRQLLIRHGKTRPSTPENLATAIAEGCDCPGKRDLVLATVHRRHEAIAHPVLYPDALPVLRTLRKAGWRIVFLSNAIGHPAYLRRPAYFDFAEAVVHSWEIGVCKPDRRAFQVVEQRTGLAPHELVKVGDSLEADVGGALNAGWAAIHLPRTSGSATSTGVVPVCTDLYQVLSLLFKAERRGSDHELPARTGAVSLTGLLGIRCDARSRHRAARIS